MSIYKFRSLILIISIVAVGIISNSCKKGQDIAEDARLIINLDVIKTTFSLKFVDAKSGLNVGTNSNNRVKLTLTGPSKDEVVDIMGTYNPDYKYNAANGFFSCGLVNTIHPSLGNPIQFTILASLDGYISTSISINIYEELDYIYEVKMVKKDDLPVGVISAKDNSGSASNGVIDNDINIATSLIPSTNTSATLSLPQGALLKDASGNPLNGSLDVSLIYFNGMDDESLSSYPGGLLVDIEGLNELKSFFSTGLVSLEIKDATGNIATTIENGTADLSIEIPANTFNAIALRPIAQGDAIDLWTYNKNSGEWINDGNAIINQNSGLYSVTSQLSHFSTFRWSWLWDVMCKEGANLVFQSADYPCNCIFVKANIREKLTGNNLIVGEDFMYACMGKSCGFINVPANISVGVEIETPCNSNYSSREPEYLFSDLCSGESREVWMDVVSPSTFIVADISAMCKNSPYIVVKPTMGGWYKREGEECWRWAHMYSGIVDICDVEVGARYTVGFYYDETWEELIMEVYQGEDYYEIILLTPDICNNLNY